MTPRSNRRAGAAGADETPRSVVPDTPMTEAATPMTEVGTPYSEMGTPRSPRERPFGACERRAAAAAVVRADADARRPFRCGANVDAQRPPTRADHRRSHDTQRITRR